MKIFIFLKNAVSATPTAERPNGHLPENQSYPELPQDMGDLWSHWVGSVRPEKMGVSGQKTAFSAQNSAFFYATPIKPPFFRLRRSRLNGIISPPYPEVTLDTFGFPVGGRLAARRTVSWPRLPKVALSGPQNAVFWPEIIFLCPASKKIVTIIAGHLKDNLFVSPHCRVVSRGPSGPIFRPKNGPKIWFFYATPI